MVNIIYNILDSILLNYYYILLFAEMTQLYVVFYYIIVLLYYYINRTQAFIYLHDNFRTQTTGPLV